MKKDFALALLSVIIMSSIGVVCAQTLVSPQNMLQCRSCSRARFLADCTHLMICDATLEECYMDQILTDQGTIVYEGGCRAKDVCARNLGRKRDRAICSQCCNLSNDCNKRLCGIPDGSTTTYTQCYSCNQFSSGQGEVSNPKDCVTLDACHSNEVCYVQQNDVGGSDTFIYGCKSKLQCTTLMKHAYELHRICDLHETSLLEPGSTFDQFCTGQRQLRAMALCHSCCADNGCNYGSCQELTDRLFKLADAGKFDFNTLKTIP